MPLTLKDASLDWSLIHALSWHDTDIFPEVFEFDAIREDWDAVKTYIKNTDILNWEIRAFRRCLVPKHRFGFRISTQLDPLDFLVFTALVYEVGQELELERIPTIDDIVHSFRFQPEQNGRMFSEHYSFHSFQQASLKRCEEHSFSHVVIADIADFYPRLYTHRIENALDRALGSGHMHAVALRTLINHWAGSYSYGIPVGSSASRLIAELCLSDVDQSLLSENAKYLRYSDDFRIFCNSEGDAYKYLTLLARVLYNNHGLTLQQNKTKIITVEAFKTIYLRENETRELDTLTERFFDLLDQIGIENPYEDIDYDSLQPEHQRALDNLNLESILVEHLKEEEPDLSLLKFLLRRLGQLGDVDIATYIFDNFSKFVPVIRETIEYLLKQNTLTSEQKKVFGERIISIYNDKTSTVSHLEYSRMYVLRPFALDGNWDSEDHYIRLYNDAIDDFSRREIMLAMGRSKKDFWFRERKQTICDMTPWMRRAFIYAASCLSRDEYKHWIRGINGQLDTLEQAVASWAKLNPIA